jgi:methylenetetrahydrofolate reductase (NADPH)
MRRVADLGLPEKVHILAGIMPLKSAGAARYINANVAGISVPDPIIERMARAGKGQAARDEGIRLAVETIQQVSEIPGVHGVHIMGVEWEEAIAPIVEMAGLLPRPETPPEVTEASG